MWVEENRMWRLNIGRHPFVRHFPDPGRKVAEQNSPTRFPFSRSEHDVTLFDQLLKTHGEGSRINKLCCVLKRECCGIEGLIEADNSKLSKRV